MFHWIEKKVQLGHTETSRRLYCAEKWPPLQPNWPKHYCCSGWFVCWKCHAVVNATVDLSKSQVWCRCITINQSWISLLVFRIKAKTRWMGFFFRGIFRAFLRVALKALHHTREAISTAKSIRALSVHKISQSMKLDSGIKHTQSRQHDMKHKK